MIRTRTPFAAALLRLAAATLVVLLAVLVVTEAGAQSGYSLTQEWGSVGVEDGQFRRPIGIDVDAVGNVYVADNLTGRIQKFDPQGTLLASWGGLGAGDGSFVDLIDVDVDFAGNVYALDFRANTVQRFDPSGEFVTSWPAIGRGQNVLISLPVGGISTDSVGDVYVSSSPQAAVVIFDGSGRIHRPTIDSTSGATLDVPTGIAVASDGTIYVADTFNRRVQSFASDGSALAQVTGSSTPQGVFRMLARGDVEVDSDGNLYVADFSNGRVHRYAPDGTYDQSIELRDSSGRLALPGGIAVDADGNVYVSAYYLGKILKYAPPG